MHLHDLGPGLFGDRVGHIPRRQFDDVDDRDAVLLHSVDERGHGLHAGLRFLGTARKGGTVGKAVFAGEVQKREAVGKDQLRARRSGNKVAEGLVEAGKLRVVGRGIGAIGIGVWGIGGAQRLFDAFEHGAHVDRRGPDMLVIGDVFMAVFGVFLLKGLHAVHQAHGGDVRRVQEHVLHPGVARAANI